MSASLRRSNRALSTVAAVEPSSIPVKAYYVAKLIDIRKLEGESSKYAGKKFQFNSKAVTITLEEEGTVQQFISVFQYGSVVFFNVPEQEHSTHLINIREIAMDASISNSLHYTEQYRMYINAALERTSVMVFIICTLFYT